MSELVQDFTSTRKYRIYVLMDCVGSVRYVGITTKTLAERLNGHLKIAKRKRTHRDNWIRSLGYEPSILEIEATDDASREGFWIRHYKSQGCNLTNATDGGEGITGYRHTPESRSKMSAFHKGRKRSAEVRQRMSSAIKNRFQNPEQRKKLSDALKGRKVSEDARHKISLARKQLIQNGWVHPCSGKKHSEERIRKNRAAQLRRAAMGFPGNRKGKTASEETRAKLRAAHVRRKQAKEQFQCHLL